MVDSALLERVLQLDVDSRRDLVRAVEESIEYDNVPEHVRAEVERRLAEMGEGPSSDYITLDAFKTEVAHRRAGRTA
jgi:putative addiction module component (TIGR02574 family)